MDSNTHSTQQPDRLASLVAANEELAAEQRQDLAFVWEAVSKLPERYRQAMHLFYHEGYASREIAHILGRNEATVRSDLQRGREKLRKMLKEEYGLEAEV